MRIRMSYIVYLIMRRRLQLIMRRRAGVITINNKAAHKEVSSGQPLPSLPHCLLVSYLIGLCSDGLYSDARALSVHIKIRPNRVEGSAVVEFSISSTTGSRKTIFDDCGSFCGSFYSIRTDCNVDTEGSSVRIKPVRIKSDKVYSFALLVNHATKNLNFEEFSLKTVI